MNRLLDFVAAEIVQMVGGSIDEVVNQVAQGGEETLLRRLRKNYDNLSIEDITAIQQAAGHQMGEQKPCKVCRLLAQEEFKRAED